MNRLDTAKVVVAIVAFALLGACAKAGIRFNRSAALADASEPVQQHPARPVARLLVVGDSTAVGAGAIDARASIAGRIAQVHPGVEIVNLGANGARLSDVLEQIRASGADPFDVVLVQAGGNDVIRLASAGRLAEEWGAVARAAAERSPQVILMPAGNVGTAPFFFAPVSWLMTARARTARQIAAAAARETGAVFVDLFHEPEEDPFLRDPGRFYAPDFLHPSDAGYGLWYDALEVQSGLAGKLDARRSSGPRAAAGG